ncbi:hypothetical protein LTR36_008902 [Oleoguttula mirabilis]|uniref:Uncharacterized protein n=1 Tax=Oleoguttula mirabilis TaxID=1507867 RepID=A0AAV9J800_9PEZI|nr:hypothetical protein LTR36_008902 [Oleoguttula mirabilis]
MRLFPSPFVGLHPAFPEFDHPSIPAPSVHPSVVRSGLAGLVGALPLAVGVIFRLPKARAFAFEVSAYSLLGLVLAGVAEKEKVDGHIRAFLGAQGIEAPGGTKWVDRLGHPDFDDALILGGMTGVFVASQARQPWSVSGWKRLLGAAAFGITTAKFGVSIGVLLAMGEEGRKTNLKRLQEEMGWHVTINKTIVALQEQKLRMAGISVPSVAGVVASPLVAPMRQDLSAQPTGPQNTGRDKIGGDHISWPNETNEPHLTRRVEGESAPVRYAASNYTWSVPADHAVPALETHITELRQRRRELAQEAEILWHWLAKKEADFFNLSSNGSADTDLTIAARRYVELLGQVHTQIWLDASKCDWMIADARKRIEQLQSSRSTAEHTVTWVPSLSASAGPVKLEMSMRRLKDFQKGIEERRVALVHAKTQAEQELKSILIPANKIETNPITGAQTSIKQSLQDMVRRLAEDIETAKFDAEVAGRVVADGEVQTVRES